MEILFLPMNAKKHVVVVVGVVLKPPFSRRRIPRGTGGAMRPLRSIRAKLCVTTAEGENTFGYNSAVGVALRKCLTYGVFVFGRPDKSAA